LWLAAALWVLVPDAAAGDPPAEASAKAGRPVADAAAGQAAYGQSCARCHGVTGKGDGVDAKRFYPRPRDLTMGVYKFRSTASGTPPTDEDLFRTITNGLPGSHMPDWPHLDEATRWHLVDYLKSLSPAFEQTPPQPVTLGLDPGPARDLAKGKALYEQLGCAACHGASGRANGPSAAGLVDDWGLPIRSANLTLGWNYRGGSAPRDIAMRLTTGIDGAGMPSYAEAISPQDAWHLAYYVASLQELPNWHQIAHTLQVSGELPSSVDDPRWADAERTDVPVRNVVTPAGEWAHPPTVRMVSLQAVHNGEAVAFRLTWDDPTQDREEHPDGLALLFKPAGTQGDVLTLQTWPYAGAPALDLCYWSAGSSAAAEAVAPDFDTVLKSSPAQAPLVSAASYEDGRWRLVVQRPLHPAVPSDAAAVALSGFTSTGFVVWDGGNPDTRAVSPWIDLSL
jgi:cytochrome c oxidase cbb3-type subunit 2